MHGCCNSSALSECTIPTECVASTAMSSLCTDEQCSSNNAIAKCTQSTAPECYEYQFAYEATTMTQHGCTSSGFTLTVPRSYGPTSTGTPVIITMTAPAITLHTTPGAGTAPNPADAGFTYTTTATQTIYHLTELPNSSNGSSSANIGAIVGGAVGGFAAISATAFGIFYVRRKTRKDRERKAAAAAAAAVPVSPEENTFKGHLVSKHQQSELPEQSLAEMSQPPQELDGSSIRHETSASPVDIQRPRGGRRASM